MFSPIRTAFLRTVIRITIGYAVFLGSLTPFCLASSFEEGLQAYRNQDYETAIHQLRSAQMHQDQSLRAHYYLADALVKENRLEEARAEYLRIIALAPQTEAGRLSQMGLALLDQYQTLKRKAWQVGTSSAVVTPSGDADGLVGLVTSGPNYIDEVAAGGQVVRWSPQRFPLKLYIEASPSRLQNFQKSFVTQTQRAMDVWGRALNSKLSYQLVETPNMADIRVIWVDSIDTKGSKTQAGTTFTSGLTVPNIEKSQLKRMDIRLATLDITGQPLNAQMIYSVALHELGHALGIRGHSPNPKDVMYTENKGALSLSQADINTIRLLYTQAADITNLPPAQTPKTPEEQAKQSAKLDLEIQKLEALVKNYNTNLNWNNLGNLYFQKAKNITGEKAERLYEQANSAFQQALKLEPHDARVLYNQSVLYQERAQYTQALQSIDLAIRYDQREPKYYLDKARILFYLDRKPEAQNALNDYLLREPTQGQTELVQQLKAKLK